MVAAQDVLTGRRGWALVTTLSMVLALLVAEQTPTQNASASAARSAVPAALSVPLDVRDRPLPRSPLLAPPVVEPAVVEPAVVEPTVVEPAVARAPVPAPAAAPAAAPAPPPAPAPRQPAAAPATAGLCSGDGWQQRRGQAALASLRAGAERTGFRVEFTAARKGYMGLTHLKQRRIEMFVRSCDAQPESLLRHVMAHELGHAYDTTHMSTASRAAWQRVRGIPAGTPWYGCSGCTDFATPAGDFAEVYAQWARGASSNRSKLAGAPGPTALAQLAGQFFGA